MSLRMAAPTKHPKAGTYRVRMAIPVHLRDTTGRLYGRRAELIENLGTKDAKQARALATAASTRLRAQLEVAERSVQGEPLGITERDVQALAGVFYRREVAERGADPGRWGDWDIVTELLDGQRDPDRADASQITLTKQDTAQATALLIEHSLPADLGTVQRLGLAIYDARWKVADLMRSRVEGDWQSDPAAERYPVVAPSPASRAPSVSSGMTMDVLLAGWALDRGWQLDATPIPRALYDRKRTVERLADFLGHRDAASVTKAAALTWKEDMLRRGLHASTVRNDLSECSAVWAWGLRMGKLAGENPFAGIAPPKATKKGREPRAFTDQEAANILTAARGEKGWKRWLPWVLCLTGARIGEVVQSQKEDVATIDGVLVLRVHDRGAGRSLKNEDSRRDIPLHPALVSEGFAVYVAGLKAGSPLFPDIPVDAVFGTRAANASKRVGHWLRKSLGITDELISPAHSFRHWFVGAARRVSIPVEVRSAITGHSARLDESAGYGDGMKTLVAVLAEHMAKVRPPFLPVP